MSRTATKKRQAETVLLNYFVFIGEQNFDAAERFLVAAEEAINKLAEMPGMGALRDFKNPELTGFDPGRSGDLRTTWCSTCLPPRALTCCASCTALKIWSESSKRISATPGTIRAASAVGGHNVRMLHGLIRL